MVGQYSSAAKSQLEAQGYVVTLNTVYGAGAPAGTVVSAVQDGANTTVTLNISDGAGATSASPTAPPTTAPAPTSPTAPPSPSPAPPPGIEGLEQSLNDARDAIADAFGVGNDAGNDAAPN